MKLVRINPPTGQQPEDELMPERYISTGQVVEIRRYESQDLVSEIIMTTGEKILCRGRLVDIVALFNAEPGAATKFTAPQVQQELFVFG